MRDSLGTALAVVVILIAVTALLIMTKANNDAETPHEPPNSSISETGCYYTIRGDTLQGIAKTFYGNGRFKSVLLEENRRLGVLEDSSLASGIWLFVPDSIRNWGKLGNPEGPEYEFCRD